MKTQSDIELVLQQFETDPVFSYDPEIIETNAIHRDRIKTIKPMIEILKWVLDKV